MSIRLKALLASGALVLSSGAAFAQSATATDNANVRSGPGTQYEVIDQLPAGETVNVIDCQGSWCEISMGRGDSGFVSRSLLDDGDAPRRSRVVVEPDEGYAIYEDDPGVISGLSIGGYYGSRPYYYRGGYYYWGGRWYHRRPGVTGWRERSWRRWGDRSGPGDTRGGYTNKPPRIDGPRHVNRPPRVDDGGGRGGGREGIGRGGGSEGMGRGGGEREGLGRGDRGGPDRGGPDRGSGRVDGPRGGSDTAGMGRGGGDSMGGGSRGGGGGRGPDMSTTPRGGGDGGGVGRTPDRGDRIGLDRAGGGGGGGGRN